MACAICLLPLLMLVTMTFGSETSLAPSLRKMPCLVTLTVICWPSAVSSFAPSACMAALALIFAPGTTW